MDALRLIPRGRIGPFEGAFFAVQSVEVSDIGCRIVCDRREAAVRTAFHRKLASFGSRQNDIDAVGQGSPYLEPAATARGVGCAQSCMLNQCVSHHNEGSFPGFKNTVPNGGRVRLRE